MGWGDSGCSSSVRSTATSGPLTAPGRSDLTKDRPLELSGWWLPASGSGSTAAAASWPAVLPPRCDATARPAKQLARSSASSAAGR